MTGMYRNSWVFLESEARQSMQSGLPRFARSDSN